MKIKLIKFFSFIILSMFLVACSKLNYSNGGNIDKYTNDITVTNIHKKIVRGKTTEDDLVKLFGESSKKTLKQSDIERFYKEDNEKEGGTFDLLDEYTDYYKTEKYVKVSYSSGDRFDSCYCYNNKSLGLKYVRFYIKDGVVRSIKFGDITNEKVANKDKYLRQIIEYWFGF